MITSISWEWLLLKSWLQYKINVDGAHFFSCTCTGRDANSEPCQRFFREGLTTSFIRILTDDAVSTWKPDIQVIQNFTP